MDSKASSFHPPEPSHLAFGIWVDGYFQLAEHFIIGQLAHDDVGNQFVLLLGQLRAVFTHFFGGRHDGSQLGVGIEQFGCRTGFFLDGLGIRVAFREPKRWLLADGVSVVTAVVLLCAMRRKKSKRRKAA